MGEELRVRHLGGDDPCNRRACISPVSSRLLTPGDIIASEPISRGIALVKRVIKWETYFSRRLLGVTEDEIVDVHSGYGTGVDCICRT